MPGTAIRRSCCRYLRRVFVPLSRSTATRSQTCFRNRLPWLRNGGANGHMMTVVPPQQPAADLRGQMTTVLPLPGSSFVSALRGQTTTTVPPPGFASVCVPTGQMTTVVPQQPVAFASEGGDFWRFAERAGLLREQRRRRHREKKNTDRAKPSRAHSFPPGRATRVQPMTSDRIMQSKREFRLRWIRGRAVSTHFTASTSATANTAAADEERHARHDHRRGGRDEIGRTSPSRSAGRRRR